jgi:Protein of unknown function (DUF551)
MQNPPPNTSTPHSVNQQQTFSTWVSVHERMPKINERVLVWWIIYPNLMEGPHIMALGERIGESWLSAYWCASPKREALAHAYDEKGNPSSANVSHWMPLPTQPKYCPEAAAQTATTVS